MCCSVFPSKSPPRQINSCILYSLMHHHQNVEGVDGEMTKTGPHRFLPDFLTKSRTLLLRSRLLVTRGGRERGESGVCSAVTLQQMAQLSEEPADFMHSLVNPSLSHTVTHTLTQVCTGQGGQRSPHSEPRLLTLLLCLPLGLIC